MQATLTSHPRPARPTPASRRGAVAARAGPMRAPPATTATAKAARAPAAAAASTAAAAAVLAALPALAEEATGAADATTTAALSVFGFSPIEVAIAVAPLLFYGVLTVYRSAVNPKASISDVAFLLAAFLILGNLISGLVFKVRLF